MLRRLVEHYVSAPPPGLAPSEIAGELSERELEVLNLIDRVQAVVVAHESGLV